MKCQFSGKECKNTNSLKNHGRLCHDNQNKHESSFVKYNKEVADDLRKVWNMCLTKETNESLKHQG